MRLNYKQYILIFKIFVVSFAQYSCSNNDSNDSNVISKPSVTLKWLNGLFIYKDTFGIYTENWIKIDSLNYKGLGYYFAHNNADTLFKQDIKISLFKNNVIMLCKVKNQNNNQYIEFKLNKTQSDLYIFNNPILTFPSTISYKIYNDSLIEITQKGISKSGKKIERSFELNRLKY